MESGKKLDKFSCHSFFGTKFHFGFYSVKFLSIQAKIFYQTIGPNMGTFGSDLAEGKGGSSNKL